MKANRTAHISGFEIKEIIRQEKTFVYINDRLTEMRFEEAVEIHEKLKSTARWYDYRVDKYC